MVDQSFGAEEFGRLYPRLRRFAAAISPPDVDPDDLVQDALVGLLRRSARSPIVSVERYLRSSIVNALNSEARRSIRRRRAREALLGEGPSQSVIADDMPATWHPYLASLTPMTRAVVYLHAVEGYTHREVAGLLGLSHTSVRLRYSRALRRLQDQSRDEVER